MPRTVSMREAIAWTVAWVSLAMAFAGLLYVDHGREAAVLFITGYVVEEALSVDNMFVFLVIFRYFAVPERLRHRVLFYGILGALVMRGLFIGAGAFLLARFSWLIYVFGAFLVYTAWRLWLDRGGEYDVSTNRAVTFCRRHLPMTEAYVGDRFVVSREGRTFATPLLLVLLTVEITDVAFAVDSIPAIFGITTDPFLVFTSNIFAVAGLRALFFVLQGMYDRFVYLKDGLALVLAFIGLKMVLEGPVHAVTGFELPVEASLAVVAALIGGAVVLSLARPPAEADGEGHAP